MNPFIFGTVVTGKNFSNRKKLLNSLKDTCGSGQNILIYGERRIGKTSLIVQLLNEMKDIPSARIDLMGVISVQDFCERYLQGINSLEKLSFINKIGKLLSSLRPKITFDSNGSPELSINIEEDKNKESLIEVLELPVKLLSKKSNAIIVFDEFQDILKINELKNIQAIMRGIIQHHQNISYIFLGSKKHLLLDMFNNKQLPFYNSAKVIPLDKIDIKHFVPYITSRFKSGKRLITEKIIKVICDSADNIPNDIQRLCHAIWEITEVGDKITEEVVNKGIKQVCYYQRDLFEEIYKSLSFYQVRLLNAIAKENNYVEKISSKYFIKKYNLSSSATVYKSLNVLIDREIIIQENGYYKIGIPFLKYWLIRHNF